MTGGPRPEGLEELSKREEGFDREELQTIYAELYEEIEATSLDRRTLLAAFGGGGGLAVLGALAAQKRYVGHDLETGLAEISDRSDTPLGVRYVDDPPYEVDNDVYERPPNDTDFRYRGEIVRWIDEVGGTPADEETLLEDGLETAGTSYPISNPANEDRPIDDRGLLRANQALSYALDSVSRVVQGYSFGRTDEGLDVQKHIAEGTGFSADHLVEREPDVDDPGTLSKLLETVARLAGAADVGVGELDERWIYSHRSDGSPIEFEDVEAPIIDDDRTVIPESMDRTVVGLVEMPFVATRASPTPTSAAAGSLGYSRNATGVTTVATWIRSMGYDAIPALNDTGLSVPMAIDAGLGEFGRHGRLIHPQFGTNVRIWKVLTNMPLEVDPYVEFGASTFCESCRICVENCPSNTLSYGAKTWSYEGTPPASWEAATDEPWDSTKANGVLKWYEEPKTCLRFWIENGASCSNCIVTCPFTQGRGWLAKVFRLLSGNGRGLDGTLEALAGGHGRDRSYIGDTTLLESADVWSQRLKPYGLSQDPEFE